MNKFSSLLIVVSMSILIPVKHVFSENISNEPTAAKDHFYQNPVLAGDYPDPSVLRVGNDYYLTHSSFDYYPGLLVWHSTDLIHWERISHALTEYVGSVWAPDLIRYNEKFYIYFPAGGTNWVVTADAPEGPWTAPVDLNLHGYIDPGHVADAEGNRYLYLSRGYLVKMTQDGLATDGEPVQNYEGWQFPKLWSTECFCLESPKSTVKDDYFYLTSAEGGTAGPATSHMVVSARSKSPFGPFENSPNNPVIHTKSRSERWWSQGHGTLVDDMDGNWWIMYHAYEKGFHSLGRQTLLLPIEWTDDNWFRVPKGITSEGLITMPSGNSQIGDTSYSDDFSDNELGLQWQFYKLFAPDRIELQHEQLVLHARGKSFADSSPLLINSAGQKYEVQVEFTLEDGATAGMCLFYNERGHMRIEVDATQISVFNQQNAKTNVKNELGNHGYLRILNDENKLSFYYSADGSNWIQIEKNLDASGFNHNVLGEFLSIRPGIYAFGKGKVTYDNFVYKKL